MMQSNIRYGKRETARREAYDRSFNHLINPVEFQQMDIKEAERYKLSRQKRKKTDDSNNRYIQVERLKEKKKIAR